MTYPITPTTEIRNVSKTWKAVLYGRYESGSATVRLGDCIVTLSADGDGALTASINGETCPWTRADEVLRAARRDGELTLLEEFRTTIGKPAAAAVHRELGRLGVHHPNHYLVAAATVGRPITSLTQLQPHEVGAVLGYAAALIAGAA